MELQDLIHQVDHLWADHGLARPVYRAPLEHLRNIPRDKLSPQAMEASGKVVECFYRCCFGGLPILPTDIQELHQTLERARIP